MESSLWIKMKFILYFKDQYEILTMKTLCGEKKISTHSRKDYTRKRKVKATIYVEKKNLMKPIKHGLSNHCVVSGKKNKSGVCSLLQKCRTRGFGVAGDKIDKWEWWNWKWKRLLLLLHRSNIYFPFLFSSYKYLPSFPLLLQFQSFFFEIWIFTSLLFFNSPKSLPSFILILNGHLTRFNLCNYCYPFLLQIFCLLFFIQFCFFAISLTETFSYQTAFPPPCVESNGSAGTWGSSGLRQGNGEAIR